ncbi:MAG: hypothetical protein WAN97_11650 [Candidatus Acidiferrales bacterium]
MRFRFRTLVLALAMVPSAFAYEYPLSPTAIRDAYFLGSGPKGTSGDFYSKYVHNLAIPPTAPPVSYVSIETPYLQIAEHSRDALNYDARDAVKEFQNKAMTFRFFTEVYYRPRNSDGSSTHSPPADETHDIQVRLLQHDREVDAEIADRWDLTVFRDAETSVESVGQHVELTCRAEKIDSSPLTVEVETPDGQRAETTFDLAEMK